MSDLSGTCLGEDPVAILLKECLKLIIAIRYHNNTIKQQTSSDYPLILGGNNEYFKDFDEDEEDEDYDNDNRGEEKNKIRNNSSNLSDIVNLKNILSGLTSIYSIDSLTLLNPFLNVLTLKKSKNEHIKRLTLESLNKIFTLQLINLNCINYVQAYRKTVSILIDLDPHFSNNQDTKDLIEIEIITLLQCIISTSCGNCLSDSLVYESLKKVLLIVCRRKLSDKLKVRAEYVLKRMTVHVFTKLKFMNLSAINNKYIDDEHIKKYFVFKKANDSSEFDLQEEKEEQLINKKNHENNSSDYSEVNVTPNYSLPVIIQYLELLLSLISLENKSEYTARTQVVGLELINTMVELVGRLFLKHPKLLNMISDSVFKSIALIMETNVDNILLMDKVLTVYTSIILALGWFLPRQIELTLPRLFEKLQNSSSLHFQRIIIEKLSLLWVRDPSLFINFFVKYDCSFEYHDLSVKFLTVMMNMTNPEKDLTISTFGLDALTTFVDYVYNQITKVDEFQFDDAPQSIILKEWSRKAEFINCMKMFNEKPRDGIKLLIDSKFIPNNKGKEVAKFLFENDSRLDKKQLGLLLCKPEETELLGEFMSLFNFNSFRVDEALRVLLTKFRLPGESQQIERILEAFSKRYVGCQQYVENIYSEEEENLAQVQADADSVFILSYSIIMLNTDIHNPQVKEHMSFEEYCSNLKGCYNNGNNYPQWFLEKIYASIQDKEIVMPEEHHGNEKWFDDVWNNVISSNTVITEIPKIHLDDINCFTSIEEIQFEMKLFENVGIPLIKKIFDLLVLTKDDNTISLLIDLVEKCYKICKFFKLKNMFNELVANLATMTTLLPDDLNLKNNGNSKDIVNKELGEIYPVIDIVDKEEGTIITISPHSIKLGESFKAQMCSVLYFNIFGHNKITNFLNEENWNNLIKILLVMFQDRMIINNVKMGTFYPEYDIIEQNNLSKIPHLPKADYVIDDINFKSNRGLLSSFASYLKGNDEPSEDDIKKAIKCNDCIKMINFKKYIWANDTIVTPKNIIDLFNRHILMERNVTNFKYFEERIICIIELSINLMLQYDWIGEIGYKLFNKLSALYEIENLSKSYYRRLMVYKVLVISLLNEEKLLSKLVEKEIIVSNEIFTIDYFNETLDGQYIVKVIMFSIDKNNPTAWKFLNYLIVSNVDKTNYEGKNLIKSINDYISNSENITSINITQVIDIMKQLIKYRIDIIDILFQILNGEINFVPPIEVQSIVSLIQLVLRQILDQIEDFHGNNEEDDNFQYSSVLLRLGKNLKSDKSLLKEYDDRTIKIIIDHSMLQIIGDIGNEGQKLFNLEVLKLCKDIFLYYFNGVDIEYEDKFKQIQDQLS